MTNDCTVCQPPQGVTSVLGPCVENPTCQPCVGALVPYNLRGQCATEMVFANAPQTATVQCTGGEQSFTIGGGLIFSPESQEDADLKALNYAIEQAEAKCHEGDNDPLTIPEITSASVETLNDVLNVSLSWGQDASAENVCVEYGVAGTSVWNTLNCQPIESALGNYFGPWPAAVTQPLQVRIRSYRIGSETVSAPVVVDPVL